LVDDQRVYSGEVRLNAGSYVIYQRGISAVRRDYKVWLSLLPPGGSASKGWPCVVTQKHVFSAPLFVIVTRVPTLCPAMRLLHSEQANWKEKICTQSLSAVVSSTA
jgi:hypothetical protein